NSPPLKKKNSIFLKSITKRFVFLKLNALMRLNLSVIKKPSIRPLRPLQNTPKLVRVTDLISPLKPPERARASEKSPKPLKKYGDATRPSHKLFPVFTVQRMMEI